MRQVSAGKRPPKLLHDVEIIIGHDVKQLQHLIRHLAMLTGYSNNGLECSGMLDKIALRRVLSTE